MLMPTERDDEIVRTMAFSPTVKEYLPSLFVAQEKSMRAITVIYGSLGAVITVISIFLYLNGSFFDAFLLPFGLVLLFIAFLMKPFMRLVTRPHFVGEDNVNLYVNRRFIACNACLRMESDNGIKSTIPWSAFRKMRVIDSTAYLMLSKQQAFVVPERAFPEERSWQTFLDLCTSKIADSKT